MGGETKTISIETAAYEALQGVRRNTRETISHVGRRLVADELPNGRAARTAGELRAALKAFRGKGAGRRRRTRLTKGGVGHSVRV